MNPVKKSILLKQMMLIVISKHQGLLLIPYYIRTYLKKLKIYPLLAEKWKYGAGRIKVRLFDSLAPPTDQHGAMQGD